MENAMIRPNLIERACGGWLAVTPDGSNLSFGVTAETKELALAAFYKSLKKWQEALVSK
jgi:hypothetical protein